MSEKEFRLVACKTEGEVTDLLQTLDAHSRLSRQKL